MAERWTWAVVFKTPQGIACYAPYSCFAFAAVSARDMWERKICRDKPHIKRWLEPPYCPDDDDDVDS